MSIIFCDSSINGFPHCAHVLDIMKEYRRLDDSITMRLNRNNAQWRDKDRQSGMMGSSQDAACDAFWRELVGAQPGCLLLLVEYYTNVTSRIANWKGRKAVIDYCVGVVDGAVAEDSRVLGTNDSDSEPTNNITRAKITSNQVKVSMDMDILPLVIASSTELLTSLENVSGGKSIRNSLSKRLSVGGPGRVRFRNDRILHLC